MVEYALLIAHDALGTLAVQVHNWMSGMDWDILLYVGLALVALQIAFWAFRSPS